MQFDTFLQFLQDSQLARLIDSSRYISMGVQIVHILAFTFLLALVLAFTLRALRLSLHALPLAEFARTLQRPYWLALAVAILAGVLLYLPRAIGYANNSAFGVKMALLILAAIAQGLVLRLAPRQHGEDGYLIAFAGVTQTATVAPESTLAFRTLALASALLWLLTGVAGRAIGFVV